MAYNENMNEDQAKPTGDGSNVNAEEISSMVAGLDENDPRYKQVMDRAEKFMTVVNKVMHSKETRDGLMDILKKSDDPYMTVPTAANQVNKTAVQMMKQGGIDVDQDVQMAVSQFIVSDIVELGNVSGQFQTDENDNVELYQDTMEQAIHEGLKDGSIDPIQLQLDMEDMLTDQQKTGGYRLAEAQGMNTEPSGTQVMEQHGNKRAMEASSKAADMASKEKARMVDQAVAPQVKQRPGA